mgnify:CR=1 FL=1
MNVFATSHDATPATKVADADGERQEVVTLDDLRKVLEKIDIDGDGSLDKLEFLLLAHDRSLIFSRENLLNLFECWQDEQGIVSAGLFFTRMIIHADGAANLEKIQKLNEMIMELRILRNPDSDDLI